MILQVLHCPNCQGTNVIRHGTTRQGKQRYRCQEAVCNGGTFLVDDTYPGHAVGVKQQIVDMAMNASGIRDTARVLHISPTTVIKALKKNYGGKLSLSVRRDVRYDEYTNTWRYTRWHAEHPARIRPRPKHSNHASGTVHAVATRCGRPITTIAPSRRSQVSCA